MTASSMKGRRRREYRFPAHRESDTPGHYRGYQQRMKSCKRNLLLTSDNADGDESRTPDAHVSDIPIALLPKDIGLFRRGDPI